MTVEPGPVRAPDFPTNVNWLQGGPLTKEGLRGKPFLVDFWDYTCINCLHTLPYIKEWHRRYRDAGLTIIGVHAPEFSFAHNADHVRVAVAEHGLEYPIVVDNDYAVWQAYANKYWPAKYLVDHEGYLRYYHFGEGAYDETELAIQTLLRQVAPDAILPPLLEPQRAEDKPGAVCYRVTPELYLGYQRGRVGNTAGIAPDKPAPYRDLDKHAEGYFFLEGDWLLTGESSARPVGAQGESKLHVKYMAKEVNLVMMPPLTGPGRLSVFQDGVPLAAEDCGADTKVEGGNAVVDVAAARMYRLINNREIDTHELTLVTTSDGLSLYAFTFTSCLVPAP